MRIIKPYLIRLLFITSLAAAFAHQVSVADSDGCQNALAYPRKYVTSFGTTTVITSLEAAFPMLPYSTEQHWVDWISEAAALVWIHHIDKPKTFSIEVRKSLDLFFGRPCLGLSDGVNIFIDLAQLQATASKYQIPLPMLIVMVTAHEAVHLVQDAQGIHTKEWANKKEYFTDPLEAQAVRESLKVVKIFFPQATEIGPYKLPKTSPYRRL